MSTNADDQHLVAGIADRSDASRIVPAFGHHPWFVHRITATETPLPSKEEHYRSLFPDPPLIDEGMTELELLMPSLPEPIALSSVLNELRTRLERYPHSILGEVGIDKSFRLPFPPDTWATLDQIEGKSSGAAAELKESGAAKRRLSRLQTPIEHQLIIFKAQVDVAISLNRSVSFHSVRAAGTTGELFRELRSLSNPGFKSINLDLHSCTLSAETIKQVQKTHKNIYVSFSTTINSRQKGLLEQIDACNPDRLLSESDWHSAEGLAERVHEIVDLFADSRTLIEHLGIGGLSKSQRVRKIAEKLRQNWQTFLQGPALVDPDSDEGLSNRQRKARAKEKAEGRLL